MDDVAGSTGNPEQAPPPPVPLRVAGAVTVAEGAVAVVVALVVVVRELFGAGDAVVGSYELAGIFAVLGGGTVAAGVALARGRRGGRAPSVIVQIVLAPVAWSLLTDSSIRWAGVLLGLAVLTVLGGAFAPGSLRWTGERFAAEHPPVPDPEPRAVSPRAARSSTPRSSTPNPRSGRGRPGPRR